MANLWHLLEMMKIMVYNMSMHTPRKTNMTYLVFPDKNGYVHLPCCFRGVGTVNVIFHFGWSAPSENQGFGDYHAHHHAPARNCSSAFFSASQPSQGGSWRVKQKNMETQNHDESWQQSARINVWYICRSIYIVDFFYGQWIGKYTLRPMGWEFSPRSLKIMGYQWVTPTFWWCPLSSIRSWRDHKPNSPSQVFQWLLNSPMVFLWLYLFRLDAKWKNKKTRGCA